MKKYLLLILLFFCFAFSRVIANCEIRINNQTDQVALAFIHYDYGLDDQVPINPHRSLFVNLYYRSYCHHFANFKLYRNAKNLYFSGPLSEGQIFDINP